MSITISDEALLLHARALEQDTPDDSNLGHIWLQEILGARVRKTASETGWAIADIDDAKLGEAIWRRLYPLMIEILTTDPQEEAVSCAIASIPEVNAIDEMCIALVFGFGFDRTTAASLAALRLRELTSLSTPSR